MTNIAQKFANWQPSKNALVIETLDCHTGGEPLRIITSGFPELNGESVLAKRKDCKNRFDHLRTALMFEPRGHADMYGAIVVEPERSSSHFGAIFIHNEGYSSMCGHATIALAKFAVESGVVKKTGDVTQVLIDVPCGQITAYAYGKSDIIESVNFDCVPSYVVHQNKNIFIEGLGDIQFDLAFGGAYYVYLDVRQLGITCDRQYYNQLISYGRKIKAEVARQFPIEHPFEADLSFLYGTIFIEPSETEGIHSKNVCIFADGEVDRSPTGSGVSGRAAIHFAKEELALNQVITIESILGSQFSVEVIKTVKFGEHQAIIPRVSGEAFITGKQQFIIDKKDPLQQGFILR